jgi:phosphohistidine phosphatase
MIFGHNPTITYVANLFLKKKIELLPTSGVVSLTFNTERWSKITELRPSKESVVFPKMLKS